MTYFADFSFYWYSQSAYPARNVGWLDGAHDFDRERPSESFLDALWQFIRSPVLQTRGLHECELCPRDRDFEAQVRDARHRSVHARRNGEERLIGSAEIRVFGANGAIFAAPTLIYHYVAEHHYKAPDEFARAALYGPRPPSDEYRALLQQHEIE